MNYAKRFGFLIVVLAVPLAASSRKEACRPAPLIDLATKEDVVVPKEDQKTQRVLSKKFQRLMACWTKIILDMSYASPNEKAVTKLCSENEKAFTRLCSDVNKFKARNLTLLEQNGLLYDAGHNPDDNDFNSFVKLLADFAMKCELNVAVPLPVMQRAQTAIENELHADVPMYKLDKLL